MDISLAFDVILLLIGVYLYLYSSGILHAKKFRNPKEIETFRRENGRWMRIASMFLVAMMLISLGLRFLGNPPA